MGSGGKRRAVRRAASAGVAGTRRGRDEEEGKFAAEGAPKPGVSATAVQPRAQGVVGVPGLVPGSECERRGMQREQFLREAIVGQAKESGLEAQTGAAK